jgi:hypothetical protein
MHPQTFSMQRIFSRMQPKMERLGSMWWDSTLRAQKLREILRTAPSPQQPPSSSPHTSSDPQCTRQLGSSSQTLQQQQQGSVAAAAAASRIVVHAEDAMFGQDGLLRVRLSVGVFSCFTCMLHVCVRPCVFLLSLLCSLLCTGHKYCLGPFSTVVPFKG